ncbi:hypothetical protein SLS55_010064 [Diplodia seriata]|uniref:Uncharacterized protein n=1 Tax=Diplodia seriata TaxID=420778 RepID=A0ABR3C4B5_9PEZI
MRHFNDSDQPRLPDNTNMAGFSWGYNEKMANVGGLQVLYTMPAAEGAGGIGLLQMNKMNKIVDDGEWQSIDAANSSNPFQSVARYSSVAATEAGRVYAVVEDGGSGKAELREWEWVQEDLAYALRGTVNTDVSRS